MQLFLDISQGVGLANAAGVGFAVLSSISQGGLSMGTRRGIESVGRLILILATLATGGLLAALSLSSHGSVLWPAIVVGAVIAAIGKAAIGEIIRGVRQRLKDQGSTGVLWLLFLLIAVVLALLALLIPPVSYLAAATCGWILVMRRRQAKKYAGLRILR